MKYNEDTIQKIEAALAGLKGRVQACKEADISYQTFTVWMKDKPEFAERIKKAEEQANENGKGVAIMSIFRAMKGTKDKPGQWQAAAWWLERNFPEYAQRLKQEHSGPDGGPIETATGPDLSKLSKAERKKLLELHEKIDSE